jgi:hypothetical protein
MWKMQSLYTTARGFLRGVGDGGGGGGTGGGYRGVQCMCLAFSRVVQPCSCSGVVRGGGGSGAGAATR